MEWENKLRLENCRKLCDVISRFDFHPDAPLKESPDRLIGYPQFTDIFTGLIPSAEYDDTGNFSYLDDFPEIFPNSFPTQQKTGSAVLFTGESGCGKHTADYTFMSVVYQYVEEEVGAEMAQMGDYSLPKPSDIDAVLEYYLADLSAAGAYAERRLSDELDALFEQVYDKAFSRPAVMVYVSLGDVTRILDSKKLAPRFAQKVRLLTADTRARCVLTCIYNGKASQLTDDVKHPFYVLELAPPEANAREEFFRYLTERYPGIDFGMDARALTQLTDGFTFAGIKQLSGYLLMAAKSGMRKQHLKMSDLLLPPSGEKPVALSEQTVRTYAQLIGQAQYEPHSEQAPAAVIGQMPVAPYVQQMPVAPYVQPMPVPATAPPVGAAAAPSSKGADETENTAESMVSRLDTPSQLRNAIDSMIVPANYKPQVLMNHQTFYSSVFSVYVLNVDDFLNWCSKKGLTTFDNLKSITISLGGQLVLHPFDKKQLNPSSDGKVYDYRDVIREGRVEEENLKNCGKDHAWLEQQLRRNGCQSAQDVFLGFCNEHDELVVFRKQ